MHEVSYIISLVHYNKTHTAFLNIFDFVEFDQKTDEQDTFESIKIFIHRILFVKL